jgi:hypothetical protein
MRQQTYSQFSQSEAFLCLGLFDKTNLQIVPKSGLLICASELQIYKCLSVKLHLQVNVQVHFKCSYKCSVCLTVILTVTKFRILDSSF